MNLVQTARGLAEELTHDTPWQEYLEDLRILLSAWFGDTPLEHPFSHNTPSGSVVDPGPGGQPHEFPLSVKVVCTYLHYKQQKNLKRNIFKWIERGGP